MSSMKVGPEISDIVNEVVQKKLTPAYELIGYFNHLDSVEKLTDEVKRELESLLKKHNDYFFQRVLSLETQYYMNTHRSDASIEQSVCSMLNIDYSYKLPPKIEPNVWLNTKPDSLIFYVIKQ